MKAVKRAQLQAGRYKQKAEVWRYEQAGTDQYGQPINIWSLHKKIRCFIDGTAGMEWFGGDMVYGKETFYFEFRHADVLMRDNIRFVDKRGRFLSCNLTSAYEEEIGGRFMRALGYVLSADEQTMPPSKLHYITTPPNSAYVPPTGTGGTGSTGGTTTPKPDHKLPKPFKDEADENGGSIYFNMPIEITGDIKKAFQFHINGSPTDPLAVFFSSNPADDNLLLYTLSVPLFVGDIIEFSYVDNLSGIEISSKKTPANKMENQTYSMNNNSKLMRSKVVSYEVDPGGQKITLETNGDFRYVVPAGSAKTFDIVTDGVTQTVNGDPSTIHGTKMDIVLLTPIYVNQKVIVKTHITPGITGLFSSNHGATDNARMKEQTIHANNGSTKVHAFPMPTGVFDPTVGNFIKFTFPELVTIGSNARLSVLIESAGVSLGRPKTIDKISDTEYNFVLMDGKKIYKGQKIDIIYNNGYPNDNTYKIVNVDGIEAPTPSRIKATNKATMDPPIVGTAPKMLTAETATDEHHIEITFDQDVTLKDTNHANEFITGNNNFAMIINKLADPKKISLYFLHPFKYGDVIRVTYNGSAVLGTVGGLPLKFSIVNVVNHLQKPITAFSFVSAKTGTDGYHVEALFSKDLKTADASKIKLHVTGSDAFGGNTDDHDVFETATIDSNNKKLLHLSGYNVEVAPGLTATFDITDNSAIVSTDNDHLKIGVNYPIVNALT